MIFNAIAEKLKGLSKDDFELAKNGATASCGKNAAAIALKSESRDRPGFQYEIKSARQTRPLRSSQPF